MVKPCQRLGMVEISQGDRVTMALFAPNGGRGTDWPPTLKDLALKKGADTLYYSGSGSSGEAYLCKPAASASPSVVPR